MDIWKSFYAGKEEGIEVLVMTKKPKRQSPEMKELISKLIDEFVLKSAKDIEDMFKDMPHTDAQRCIMHQIPVHLRAS